MAILSIMGMYNFKNAHGGDLFSKLVLPDGIDKDALTDNILLRSAEFEALYSNPDFFENVIGVWSKKHYHTFDKWVKALSIDYNPLENYDRIETWNETNKNNGSKTDVVKSSIAASDTTRSNGEISDSTSSDTDNVRSAYNSNQYEPHDASRSSGSSNSNSMNNTTSTSNVSNGSDSETITSDNSENVHNGRIHGNIGVTTSQMMLQSELDIAKFNLIEQITDLFVSEFCILVY